MRTQRFNGGDDYRYNNIGSLRLAFAALVVVSHSPELIDGNRSREILTSIFGTLSFGEVAVDGFFLISGYLIIKSFENSASIGDYVTKRVLRIYPGFIVASLVSILIVGPISGAHLDSLPLYTTFKSLILLRPAALPGAFASLHYPVLNGAMWTIAYEFRCYLLVLPVGYLLSHTRRRSYGLLLMSLAALYAFRLHLPEFPKLEALFGRPADIIRLASVFFVGGAFHVWRDRITYTKRGALIAAAGLIALLFVRRLAEPAVAILGSYVTFYYAFSCGTNRVSQLADKTDPSYGLYLYAWPIQELLILYVPGISPWITTAITLPVALMFGIASWFFVERPALKRKDMFVKSIRMLRASPKSLCKSRRADR